MMNAITNSKSVFYREAMTVYCRAKPTRFFRGGLRGNVSFLVRVRLRVSAAKMDLNDNRKCLSQRSGDPAQAKFTP